MTSAVICLYHLHPSQRPIYSPTVPKNPSNSPPSPPTPPLAPRSPARADRDPNSSRPGTLQARFRHLTRYSSVSNVVVHDPMQKIRLPHANTHQLPPNQAASCATVFAYSSATPSLDYRGGRNKTPCPWEGRVSEHAPGDKLGENWQG